jgi:hypothetical protein
MGKGVLGAVKNVNLVLADAVMGMDSADQRAIVAPADLAHILRHRYDAVAILIHIMESLVSIVNFLHLEESFRSLCL